jgi:uncharacterized membrane protein
MLKRIRNKLRNIFLAGLLVIIPVSVPIILLSFLFTRLDRFFSPLLSTILGYNVPGLGVSMTVITIILVGLIATNFIGKKLVGLGEQLFNKIPLVRNIYQIAKQFLETIAITDRNSFRQVVLVEYPRKGIYSLGFITCDDSWEAQDCTRQDLVNVFIPITPNPTSGRLIIVPDQELIPLSMNVEDGIKMVVSGGAVVPKEQKKELLA